MSDPNKPSAHNNTKEGKYVDQFGNIYDPKTLTETVKHKDGSTTNINLESKTSVLPGIIEPPTHTHYPAPTTSPEPHPHQEVFNKLKSVVTNHANADQSSKTVPTISAPVEGPAPSPKR